MSQEKDTNVCQCCLGDDDLKSLLKEYTYNGVKEIYQDILYDCLSIKIATPPSNPDECLICNSCVDQLRNILLFKQQINESQNKLAKLHEHNSEDDYVKEEISSDEENKEFSPEKEIKHLLNKNHKRKMIDNNNCKSNDVLKKALERTKKNLQLLQQPLSSSNSSDEHKWNDQENKLEESGDGLEPEDKKERKKYLQRKRYARSVPFKLEKTDRSCKVCNETFPSFKSLVLHMPEHYQNYICNHCGKPFILKTHLQRHLSRTHSEFRVACPTCNKLVKKDSLRRHISTHTGNQYIYECYYCPEKFIAYATRITHMVTKHGHKGNEYKCHICSRVFKISSELTVHMKSVHFGIKDHKCNICDKRFFNSYKVKLHMVKHTQEKNYECQVCHKKFGRKYTLREHLKIHYNIKDHVCSICQREFTQRCTLRNHIKTHDK